MELIEYIALLSTALFSDAVLIPHAAISYDRAGELGGALPLGEHLVYKQSLSFTTLPTSLYVHNIFSGRASYSSTLAHCRRPMPQG